MRAISICLLILSLQGCSHASTWLVSSTQEGGVVAYQGFNDPEKAREAIAGEIHQMCSEYDLVRDDLRSQQYVSAIPNFYTGGTIMSAGTQYWREATFVCKDRAPASKQ